MSIEPPSLNIPLEQNEPWGRVLLFAWILGVGISAFFSPHMAQSLLRRMSFLEKFLNSN
jgi:hypothetical protein